MQLQALLSTDGLDSAKALVSNLIATSDDIRLKYGWAKPIFEKTTEKFIKDSLVAEPPKRIYRINPLSENISIAGQLLELAIARQDAIYGLEISSLNAIVDDLVFSETSASQQKIAEANLGAALAQAPGNGGTVSADDIKQIFDIQRSTNAFRAASRLNVGGALNFAERVEFLREQQAETVRSIYERLLSVMLVLPSSGLGKPQPLPQWQADGGLVNLRKLAKWIKDAIKSVERGISNETLIDLTFSTAMAGIHLYDGNDQPISSTDLVNRIGAGSFDDFKFDFDWDLIVRIANVSGPRRIRMIAAGVGVVFDEDLDKIKAAITNGTDITAENAKRELLRDWRSRLRMGGLVVPPRQRGTLADGSASEEWGVSRIVLFDSISATATPDLSNMTMIDQSKMLNLNPIGRWTVSFNPFAKTAQDLTALVYDKPFGTNTKMTNVLGLIFCFRVAYE